jgi:GNAT superfamily N-acetyltransferase
LTYYVDNEDEVGLLVRVAGRQIRAEGRIRRYTEFATWCRRLEPTKMETTQKTTSDCLDHTFGPVEWREAGAEYTATDETFQPHGVVDVRKLTPDDRPVWRRFVQRYAHEPMVNGRPGSQAGVRDFEFMCMGLPVAYYVTMQDDEITGFLSVNRFTETCDEIASLFVPPEFRRRGLAASLLSAATRDILAAGHRPGYHAGGSPVERPDLFGLLTKLGFYLVAVPVRVARE